MFSSFFKKKKKGQELRPDSRDEMTKTLVSFSLFFCTFSFLMGLPPRNDSGKKKVIWFSIFFFF